MLYLVWERCEIASRNPCYKTGKYDEQGREGEIKDVRGRIIEMQMCKPRKLRVFQCGAQLPVTQGKREV